MKWYVPSLGRVPRLSENCYVGVALQSVKELYDLAKEHKAVIYSSKWGSMCIKPAAWEIHQQAIYVQELIDAQKYYYCVKKEDF